MSTVHHERVFGDAIVAAMVGHGWRAGAASHYDPRLGLDTAELFAFLGATQADKWEELIALYGGDPDTAQSGFTQRVADEITSRGTLDVLRTGVKDRGVRIKLAYFRPSLTVAADALTEYAQNRLTVVRELPYATGTADAGNRLDLTLFVNGLPVATAELKNPLTGQNVEHAKKQYRTERDPRELIFAHRALVHFAVDPDLVFVTTRLRGKDALFLPFNTGSEGPGNPGGAGNPPASEPGAYRTSYLWDEIWHPDTWLDLLDRFLHIHQEKSANGRKRGTLIFPRYHQWHAVRRLVAHAARHGAGHNYLVMHSAGSGKSNTIAWLAHRLSSLHTFADPAALDPAARAAGLRPNTPVFDKVLVITDRTVLDRQLQETVGSFERTAGLVVRIDGSGGSKSAQLAGALSQETGKIILVTLQTFPSLLDYLRREPKEVRGRRFAIVVDEAHSSQSGEAAADVKKALRQLGLDADDEEAGDTATPAGAAGVTGAAESAEEATNRALAENAAARGHSAHLSYFAFTATPKAKTLELFGVRDPATDKYRPFHTYSMRQAIDEGFILDPLRNYVTYGTFYNLVNANPADREVERRKANAMLARFAHLHPSTLAQHAQVIVEHFRAHTAGRLGGRAKAMVVTRGRQAAVELYRAIRQYVGDTAGAGELGVLVAFSGTLSVDGEEVTEAGINGFPESELPERFGRTRADAPSGAASHPEYRILVVAEKYQTGFDQPLLTTMYVEKELKGIAAVQTLSRLNRTHPRKSQGDLFVLDFANKAEDIQEAFRPFHEQAETMATDPNLLYTAERQVMAPPILVIAEMQEFAAAYLAAQRTAASDQEEWKRLHAELYRYTHPARDRFVELLEHEDEEEREAAERFRSDLTDYVRKYGFLAQIVPYADPELERLYLFGRHLLNQLPRRQNGGVDIGQIDLSHIRVRKTGEYDVSLSAEGTVELPGFAGGGGKATEPEKSLLSELVEKFNARFGTEFTEEDLAKPFNATLRVPAVQQAALVNDVDGFGHVFDREFENQVMDHIDTVTTLSERYFARDTAFKTSLNRDARNAAWQMIRRQNGLDEAV